jgi:hypothetical protein
MACLGRLSGPLATALITGSTYISEAQVTVSPLNLVNFNSPFDSHRRSLLLSPPLYSPLQVCVVIECPFKPSINTALCFQKGPLPLPCMIWLSHPNPFLQTSSPRKSRHSPNIPRKMTMRLLQPFPLQHHSLQSHNGPLLLWAQGTNSVSHPVNDRYQPPCTSEQRFATTFTVWIAPANTSEVSPLLS